MFFFNSWKARKLVIYFIFKITWIFVKIVLIINSELFINTFITFNLSSLLISTLLSYSISLVTLVPRCTATHKIPSDLRSRVRLALHMEQIHQTGAAACEAERPPPCPPSKFRSPTGECNNINHRDWGARGDILLRLFEANYADGRSTPRNSQSSHALPPPESIVAELQTTTDPKQEHPHITAMLPAWGQLLAYDLVDTVTPSLSCCQAVNGNKTQEQVALCYVPSSTECVDYKRSAPSYEIGTCDFSKCIYIFINDHVTVHKICSAWTKMHYYINIWPRKLYE